MKPYYHEENIRIYHKDNRTIDEISAGTVDLLLTDMPYGVTENKWDIEVDISSLFKIWWSLLKEKGNIVLTSQEPFTSKIVLDQPRYFRYDLIWDKIRTSGFLNANRQPLRSHEHILIFYRKFGVYNPQMVRGQKSHSRGRMAVGTSPNYGKYKNVDTAEIRGCINYPKSVLSFMKPHPAIHPTEKPVNLFQWLINTYSNPGDLVLDPFLGSGSTALACKKLGRRFIGYEIEERYCKIAADRCRQGVMKFNSS